MRSGLIFAVSERITNRYMLCRMLAASARKMHRDGCSTSQNINRSLQVLQDTAAGPAARSDSDSAPKTDSAVVEAPTEDAALVP